MLAAAISLAFGLIAAAPALAQVVDNSAQFEGRVVEAVRLDGLQAISEGFVRRIIKTRAEQPFVRQQLQQDVRDLLQTRKFIDVRAETDAGATGVVVTFRLLEKPTIVSVDIEGNRALTDDKLYDEVTVVAGGVLDMFEVTRSLESLRLRYREEGYYYAEVTLDQDLLESSNQVVFRVTEGPRVRVREIVFEGVRAFSEVQLRLKVKSNTALWIFRTGALDEEQADRDALAIQDFYRDAGHLDARVGYRLDFDEVSREDLTLVFVVEEGDQYRIRNLNVSGAETFEEARIREEFLLAPGAVLRREELDHDVKAVQTLYGEIGFVDVVVNADYEFAEEPGLVDLFFEINENARSKFGRITVRGNTNTKDEVVRRELRFFPGEDYNVVKTRQAERRLRDTGLFSKATITPLQDVDGFREALVEVEEAQNITFLIGAAVSTDSGLVGTLTLENRNFDLFDLPVGRGRDFWSEVIRGQAFRGAGQRLRLQAEPGSELSRFRIDFTEPYLFDLPLRFDTSLYLFSRGRDGYDEQRLGFQFGFSRRFESGLLKDWAGEVAFRFENVGIDDLQALAANDIRDARGDNFLTSLKLTIVRDTTDSRLFPTEGYRFSLGWEQVGAFGGDEFFGKPLASFNYYHTVDTDVFDRKSVLAFRTDVGYIAGEAPVYERFYGGGFGSIRGFSFRSVSPDQGIFNNRVGGDFILLTGAEYSFPLFAETVRGVTFIDMGTVEEEFTIEDWRVSVGFGLRIAVPFFGPVPIVLDFGFPIAEGDNDDTQVFNFSFGASF